MTRKRLAVVLFNLGGPDGPEAVRPFLFNLFKDPAIIGLPLPPRLALAALISTTRTKSARANYAIMGGGSPILQETRAQADALDQALAEALPGQEAKCFIAMRYWKPFTEETARAVEAFAPDEVVLLPLYPQFSTTTTASSLKAWREAYSGPGMVRAVCCYPDGADFAQAHADAIRAAWNAAGNLSPVRLLFSAHGLPEKVVAAGDPYQSQVEAGARAIAERLGAGWDWQVCYQSRVGPLKWIGPSTVEAITAAAQEGKGVVVCPVAFVSEHVETLVELDHDYGALAKSLGCPAYVRVPALGTAPAFIAALAKIVGGALDRSPATESACGGRWCGAGFSRCPARGAAMGAN
ncbi:MAG: ferrochelatase [Proteobacteria bacterium]|nr:ferrochelatase [Pseudomonadota bacterium]